MYNKIKNIEGISIKKYAEIYENRTDMTMCLTHLTKPSQNELDNIKIESKSYSEIVKKTNEYAVDNLIRILKCGHIQGSTRFVVNGKNKPAVCFQEVSFSNLEENIRKSMDDYIKSSNNKLRYCGVGVGFDKRIIYMKGGRPVIYEEKEKAKQLLNYNKDEYWRIVNLKLEFYEPIEYDVDPIDINYEDLGQLEDAKTKTIDFMYEREWRVPNHFEFDIDEDLTSEKNMYVIFPTNESFDYFENQLKQDYLEEKKLLENTRPEDMYHEDKVDNILKHGIEYYCDDDDFDWNGDMDRQEIIIDECRIYKLDFLKKLDYARYLDNIDLYENLTGHNRRTKIQYIILNCKY